MSALVLPSPSILKREDFGVLLNLRELVGEAVEVGTHRAEFAEQLLQTWRGERLFCVDPWQKDLAGYDNDVLCHQDREPDRLEALRRLQPFKDRIRILRTTSEQAAGQFGPNCLDFVYLDGNHEFIEQDLGLWYRLVGPGGILAGHDFNGDWEHVVRPAVEALAERLGQPVYVLLGDAASWYILKTDPPLQPDGS